jgi:hypothetical protein
MKYLFFLLLALAGLFTACSGSTADSKNPYVAYFYPVDSIPKIYLYRDVANGLDEQFHRIYAVKDAEGEHVIVEIYSADGRILEALNYNLDSLDIMDHMVVNRKGEKTKAELFKYKLMPMNDSEETYFASRFQGFLDSTLILKEIRRKVSSDEISHDVMGEEVTAIKMTDKIRMSSFNPFAKRDNTIQTRSVNYFAKGFGLVEYHSMDKSVHYKLEKVLSQEEWLKLVTR